MNGVRLIISCVALIAGALSLAAASVMDQVNQLEQQGQFVEAVARLDSAIKDKSLSKEQRKELEFELDRLDRIKKDFPYSKDDLFGELKASVKDLTHDEYDQWVKEGRFDSREIDG